MTDPRQMWNHASNPQGQSGSWVRNRKDPHQSHVHISFDGRDWTYTPGPIETLTITDLRGKEWTVLKYPDGSVDTQPVVKKMQTGTMITKENLEDLLDPEAVIRAFQEARTLEAYRQYEQQLVYGPWDSPVTYNDLEAFGSQTRDVIWSAARANGKTSCTCGITGVATGGLHRKECPLHKEIPDHAIGKPSFSVRRAAAESEAHNLNPKGWPDAAPRDWNERLARRSNIRHTPRPEPRGKKHRG